MLSLSLMQLIICVNNFYVSNKNYLLGTFFVKI